jgi:hypothetical protein
MGLAPDYALHAKGLHHEPDGAKRHVNAFSLHLVPDIVGTIDREILIEDPKYLRLQRFIPADTRRRSIGSTPPRIRLKIVRRAIGRSLQLGSIP